MKIKILGMGCKKCQVLFNQVSNAVKKMPTDNIEVIKVEDIVEISKYRVMKTPALVINDEVVVSGRIASIDEITQLIEKRL